VKAVKTDDEGNQRGNPIDAARTLKINGRRLGGYDNTADVESFFCQCLKYHIIINEDMKLW
jgi:hypothetical protein